MPHFKFDQALNQFTPNQKGDYYLKLRSDIVYMYDKKEKTELTCIINTSQPFHSNIHHSDDGHYHIVIPENVVKSINKAPGDPISFVIYESRAQMAC